MTAGSLFSGIGGLDRGFELAGMKCTWQVEINEQCRTVLERHFPGVERFHDVREVGNHNLRPVDLVCGGFPCQDLSVAGRRSGLAGERSGLWFEFHRVIAELKPRWAVIENVPGLLSSRGGRDFAVILRGLVELGYGVCWRVLDAQYFGVAQRRRRVFIVASLGDGSCAEVLFEREGVRWNPPPRGQAGEGTARSVAPSLRIGHHGLSGIGKGDEASLVVPTLSANGDSHTGHRDEHGLIATFDERNVTSKANRTRFDYGAPAQTLHESPLTIVNLTITMNQRSRIYSEDGIAPTLQSEDGRGHGSPTVAMFLNSRSERYDAESQTLLAWHENKGGSFTPSDHAKALRSGASHSYQGVGVRRLTPVECCRLQAFPDDWLDGLGLSDTTKYAMLGNAVCVAVAEWIGQRIMRVDKPPPRV